MARGWRVLDATSLVGSVEGRRGRIRIADDSGTVQEIPAGEIAVLLLGSGCSLTPSAIHYLAKHDVAALMVDWRGVPFAGIYPWGEHGRVAARHLAQASLSAPRRKNAWMRVIRAKIYGQAATLDHYELPGAPRLRELAAKVRSGDPTNVEGGAARHYWANLFIDRPFIRDHENVDTTNAMLNYGYMVLRGFGVRAVLSAGLSPPIGLFHRGRSNYFNLVDDLMEPFRPAVDTAVLRLGAEASLEDPGVKRQLVEAATQPFSSDGYRIPKTLEDFAQQLGRYVEGDVDILDVPRWQGPLESPGVALAEKDEADEPPW